MLQNILATIAGYAVWTIIFLGGSAGIRIGLSSVHDEAGLTSNVMALSLYLLLSVIASFAAGQITGRLATAPAMRWVWILAVLLLATGIPVQLSVWDSLPVWYNLAFLIMLVPVTLLGGKRAAA